MSDYHHDPDKLAFGKLVVSGLIGLTIAHTAMGSDTEQYVQEKCASCHALSEADIDTDDITERMHRKAPPLYYAGDKFRKEWLQSWLEAPARIRPGGGFPPDHTVVTDDGDVIDQTTLSDHPSVPTSMASDVAALLMTLHLKARPTLQSVYQPQPASLMLGKMNFDKFKGCSACHRDAKDVGGLSGPELYTAWNRLQPEFIVSYIGNPVAWDAHSMMPNKHLREADIHKLVDYVKLIGEARP